MRNSQDNEKHKPTIRTAGGMTSKTKAQQAPREPEKTAASPMQANSTSSAGPILTQEEFRARVAQKAFALFQKRQALTEVDDWVEAERLVKLQLLDEQRGVSV